MSDTNTISRYKTTQNRRAYEFNKIKVLKENEICGICGQVVDKKYGYPNPLSATVDHIIPISKGGSIIDIKNLQLAHNYCNRRKWDTIKGLNTDKQQVSEVLNVSRDWSKWQNE
jgi:5-methylcytosine-specific restriction endonuclease McrA